MGVGGNLSTLLTQNINLRERKFSIKKHQFIATTSNNTYNLTFILTIYMFNVCHNISLPFWGKINIAFCFILYKLQLCYDNLSMEALIFQSVEVRMTFPFIKRYLFLGCDFLLHLNSYQMPTTLTKTYTLKVDFFERFLC